MILQLPHIYLLVPSKHHKDLIRMKGKIKLKNLGKNIDPFHSIRPRNLHNQNAQPLKTDNKIYYKITA